MLRHDAVGGAEGDLRWPCIASAVVPGPQASPIIPEMALCNVSANSPMAARIIYELE
jgi:hypothetical protein